MAFDEQLLLQAIYDFIHDALTQAPPGPGRPAASAGSFLTLAFPGMGLDAAQLANPWSPVNPDGLTSSAENLAMLTDGIPVLSPIYADSGISLDRIYGQIVNANVPPDPGPAVREGLQPADVFEAAIARAPARLQDSVRLLYTEATHVDTAGKPLRVMTETPRYRDYLRKRAAYNALVTQDMARRLQAPAASAPSPQVLEAWRAFQGTQPDELEAAVAEAGARLGSSVAGLFSAARLEYELTRRGSVFQPGLFWHLCQALPANWLEPSAVFAEVQLRSDALRLNPASRMRTVQRPGFPRPGVIGTWTRLSFRFARVEIRRPWLDASLFSLGGWSLPGRRKHALSTGTLQDNPGLFSLLPSSLIVARDIQISAPWSRAEAAQLTQALGGVGGVGFGPFVLSGNSSRQGLPKQLRPRFDGQTISLPQLQSIGWLNSVVTACPPLDG